MTSLNDFRKDFDLDPNVINLNSGTLSISPRTVVDAQINYLKKNNENPTVDLFHTWERMWSVQKMIGDFFNADPLQLFLCANVTYAMNTFIQGIELEPGGEILVSDFEYPAIVELCRHKAKIGSHRLREFSFFDKPEDYKHATRQSLVDRVKKELKRDTRMLMLSHVLTMNGTVLPIAEIGAIARNNETFFAVDGAHGPGAIEIDFQKLDSVDFYGANLHKWFLGPKGTGFGWIHQSIIDRVDPLLHGWTSAQVPPNFSAFAEGNPVTARFLQSSCIQFAPYFALKETVEYWNQHTAVIIRDALTSLQENVMNECAEHLDLPLVSPLDKSLRGPLVSYAMPEKHVAAGFEFMKKLFEIENLLVMTFPVKNHVMLRFSPHIYNTPEEIKTTVKAISKRL